MNKTTILREINVLKLNQADIAKTYAILIKSTDPVDFAEINRAIIDRWSRSGLERVKTMAWAIVNASFAAEQGRGK